NYWDFINTVRRDWGVNRAVPGSYIWLWPDDVLDTAAEQLARALAHQGVAIVSMNGGWVDRRRAERPPLIGFGTYVTSAAVSDYRDRIHAAAARPKEGRPGARVPASFDAQRATSPDAPRRHP